jgi:hypothetical protein
MDFHDDHTAFDTTSTDDVSHMYVPGAGHDTGIGDDTGHDDTGGDTETTGSHDGETVSINVGGHDVTPDATIDLDHDGRGDTAIVEDSAGDRIAITDTDGDGEADHAALLDESDRVVDTAHLDSSGKWVEDGAGDSNPYGGTGSTIGAGSSEGDSKGDDDGKTITVDAGGHSVQASATVDADHDGTKDTAVVQTPDGNKIAFTDSDGDGQADQATVYGSDGRLLGTAHYDEDSGNWIEGGSDTGGSGVGGDDEPGTTAAGSGSAGGIGDGSGSTGERSGDDSGIGTSPAGGTGSGGGEHIEVNVGGRSAQVDAGYDLDHDGRDETAVVQGPDGTKIAFSDTDGDGDADKAAVFDVDGKLVGTASYNEGSGTWVQDQG